MLCFAPFTATPVAAAPDDACVQAVCTGDTICGFNDGTFCGSVMGSATLCFGACQDGLCLDGAGAIDLGDGDAYSSSDLEIEFQVNVSRIPAAGETASGLVTKYRGRSAGESEWGVFVEKQGVWLLCGDGTLCVTSPPGAVVTGVLYHVRAVLRGTNAELWVNDDLVASGPVARNPANTATHVIIGDSVQPGHPNPFHGIIDEVRIGCIRNRPPQAVCCSRSVPADPGTCSASASLDCGSFDPDGDPIDMTQAPAGPYGLGATSVTLTVTDPSGASDSCQAPVTVSDITPPQITALSATPAILWPPNHRMVSASVSAGTSDACDPTPACHITAIGSNEPPDGGGDGHTSPDWQITGALQASLRAERSGSGSGRIYAITVECQDASANSSTAVVNVTVPHDR